MNVQSPLWYKLESTNGSHVATTLFHEKAGRCHPKLSSTAIIKVAETLQCLKPELLRWCNQLSSGNLGHRRCNRQSRLQKSTIYTASNNDGDIVRWGSAEKGALRRPHLQCLRPDGEITPGTKLAVRRIMLSYWSSRKHYFSTPGASCTVLDKLAARIAGKGKPAENPEGLAAGVQAWRTEERRENLQKVTISMKYPHQAPWHRRP